MSLRDLVRWALLAGTLAGCDLSEPEPAALRIITPAEDTVFSESDDVDPTAVGTQVNVVVASDEQRTIELVRMVGREPELVAVGESERGRARFPNVTLRDGPNLLSARYEGAAEQAETVTVYLDRPCGALSLLEPALKPGATELVLGPEDDRDQAACGERFVTRVMLATGLPDGSSVSLWSGEKQVGSGIAQSGVVRFDEVVFDQRGSDQRVLAARVEGKNCAPFELAPTRVDCEGPSCELISLEPGQTLSSANDESAQIAGLDLDLVVTTSADAAAQPIELFINGDADNVIRAPVDIGEGQASAHFKSIALPEGAVRVKAVCRDAHGNQSVSERTVNVDTVGCNVTVTSPTPGTEITAATGGASASVNLRARIAGPGCTNVRVGSFPSADCMGLRDLPASTFLLGQAELELQVTLVQQGDQTLCVGASDAVGNLGFVAIPVRVVQPGP